MDASETRDELLTVAETARLLRFGRTTTYRLIHTGELPAIRIGGSLRIRRVDLDALLEQPTNNGHEQGEQ